MSRRAAEAAGIPIHPDAMLVGLMTPDDEAQLPGAVIAFMTLSDCKQLIELMLPRKILYHASTGEEVDELRLTLIPTDGGMH